MYRSFTENRDTKCPDCDNYDVERKISLSSFKMNRNASSSSEKFSDSSDIGRNVEEKFKTHGLAGHVTLIKGERSKVATLASKIL